VLSPSAQFLSVYDSNVFKVEDGYDPDGPGALPVQASEADLLMVGLGRLALKLPFSHSHVSLTWLPQYRAYARNETELKTSHQAVLDAALRFSSGSVLIVRDDFVDAFFESRQYVDESGGGGGSTPDYVFKMTSTPYRRNEAMASFDWAMAALSGVITTYRNIDFSADPTEVAGFRLSTSGTGPAAGRYFDFFDYTTNAVELRAYADRSRFRLFAEGVGVITDQDRSKVKASQLESNGCPDPPDPPQDPPTNCDLIRQAVDFETIRQIEGAVGLQGALASSTVAELRLGYADWTFREGQVEPYRGVTIKGGIIHNFNARTVGRLDLTQLPIQTTGQYRGYYLRRDGAVALSKILSQHVQVSASFTYRLLDFPGSTQPPPPDASETLLESLQSFVVKDYESVLEVSYRTGKGPAQGPLLLRLGYNPYISSSTLDGLSGKTHRIALFAQYGWF